MVLKPPSCRRRKGDQSRVHRGGVRALRLRATCQTAGFSALAPTAPGSRPQAVALDDRVNPYLPGATVIQDAFSAMRRRCSNVFDELHDFALARHQSLSPLKLACRSSPAAVTPR